MTLHQLRIFDRVATYLNITKAAVALRISQPSVSQQLKTSWRRNLATKFFIRLNQGVELTLEGEEFLNEFGPVTEAENLEKRLRVNRKQTTPLRLSLAEATMFPSTFFRNYSGRLRSAIPQFSSSWKPIIVPRSKSAYLRLNLR